jgi:hypothetical protein
MRGEVKFCTIFQQSKASETMQPFDHLFLDDPTTNAAVFFQALQTFKMSCR